MKKLPAATLLSLFSLVILPLSLAQGASICGCPAECPVCEPLQVSLDASLSKSILEYGESASLSVFARNSEPNLTSLGCNYDAQGQLGQASNVTNDGQWHQIGLINVTAPQTTVDHQIGVNLPVEINCTAQLSNESGIAWCGKSCSQFTLSYIYPSYETIAEYEQVQLDAINKLSLARTAVGNAQSMVSKAESASPNSTYLDSAKEKLAISENFLTSASFMYDQINFTSSVTNSESAIAYANEAESLAYLAYGVASPATSYSYVLRLIEETQQNGGHTYEEIIQIANTLNAITGISGGGGGGGGGGVLKNALDEEKRNIEEANRLLDEARRKLKEGDYTGAVDDAVTAKSLVEKARKVLDSLFLSVKNGFLIAIETSYKSLLAEVGGISAKIDAASRQTGINLEEIKLGRNSIDYARFRLIKSVALVKKVGTANSVAELMSASSEALIELRSARSYVGDAALHYYFSLMKRYTAIGIVSVGAALLGIVVWWIEKRKERTTRTGEALVDEKQQKPIAAAQEIPPGKPMGESVDGRPANGAVRPSRERRGPPRSVKKKAKTTEGFD